MDNMYIYILKDEVHLIGYFQNFEKAVVYAQKWCGLSSPLNFEKVDNYSWEAEMEDDIIYIDKEILY
jgi:hypothetical protein